MISSDWLLEIFCGQEHRNGVIMTHYTQNHFDMALRPDTPGASPEGEAPSARSELHSPPSISISRRIGRTLVAARPPAPPATPRTQAAEHPPPPPWRPTLRAAARPVRPIRSYEVVVPTGHMSPSVPAPTTPPNLQATATASAPRTPQPRQSQALPARATSHDDPSDTEAVGQVLSALGLVMTRRKRRRALLASE